jgi:hypothetical protein
MREIKLTQGKVALVDDADYEYLNQWKWHFIKASSGYAEYGARNVRENGKHTSITIHIQLMGTRKELEIHHKNNNGLDCQRDNMEFVTKRVNAQHTLHNKTSKYVGVHWDKINNCWFSQIMLKGYKKRFLGRFISEEAACEAYQLACKGVS